MNMIKNIREILAERILIIDGAMGTMIQQYRLSEDQYRGDKFKDYHIDLKGNNDLLSITQPGIIRKIYDSYLEAGADLLETNTFNANGLSQQDYQMDNLVYDMNLISARMAREAAQSYNKRTPEKPRFVVGSIGPTNQTASLSPDINHPEFRRVSFDDVCAGYYDQVRGLVDGGADILLVETVFDTLNCKAALYAF